MAVEDPQDPVVSKLERMDATEIRDLPMFNAVSCQVSSSELETLKDMPGVARVVPDRIIQLLEEPVRDQQGSGSAPGPAAIPLNGGGGSGTAWGINRIGAPSVWDYGINGSGINVSFIDTEINANHPDLAGRVVAWKDLVNNLSSPYDDHGHGTHVAGTIAGTGAGGTKTGVAPGANLILVKVFDSAGNAYTSTLMASSPASTRRSSPTGSSSSIAGSG
jgi:serine protease AprX